MKSNTKRPTNSDGPAKFLALLDTAIATHPAKALRQWETALAITFKPEPTSTNDTFSVYESKTGNEILKSAEVRANFQKPGQCQLVNLTLAGSLELSKKEFEKHFGSAGESMGPSSPHDFSRGVYVTLKLTKPQVVLRISFRDLSEKDVTGVSFDNCSR